MCSAQTAPRKSIGRRRAEQHGFSLLLVTKDALLATQNHGGLSLVFFVRLIRSSFFSTGFLSHGARTENYSHSADHNGGRIHLIRAIPLRFTAQAEVIETHLLAFA